MEKHRNTERRRSGNTGNHRNTEMGRSGNTGNYRNTNSRNTDKGYYEILLITELWRVVDNHRNTNGGNTDRCGGGAFRNY